MQETSWSFFLNGRRRVQAEFSVGGEQVTVILENERWWRSSPLLEATTGTAGARFRVLLLGPPGLRIEGSRFIEQLEIDTEPVVTGAGRDVQRVTGKSSTARSKGLFYVRAAGIGADRYDVAVDDEVGSVLVPGAVPAGVRLHVGVFESDPRMPGPQRRRLTFPLTDPSAYCGQLRVSARLAARTRSVPVMAHRG